MSDRAANLRSQVTQASSCDISTRGAGASEPVASNDDETGRAKNRRVELVKR